MSPEFWAIFISGFSALGAFLFGLDIGYIAPIIECASFKRDVAHLEDWSDPNSRIPDATSGFIVGIFSIGCILTSFPPVSGYFLEQWGRRSSIVLGGAVFLVGAIAQAEARSMMMMLIGRFVAGMSIGFLSAVVSLYQCELAPPSLRGSLTSLYQLMITFGIFVASFMNYGLVESDGGWRIAIWFQCIPALGLIGVMPLLPRSPRWLVSQGRPDEAREALRMVRSSEAEAEQELEAITQEVERVRCLGAFKWSDLLEPYVKRLLALGVGLQVLQQLVGMNAFMYFGPRIFSEAGHSATLFQTYLQLVNFLSTFLAIFMADSFGRRPLLLGSAAGMMVACLVLGFCGSHAATHPVASAWIVASTFFFVANFSYGWGPMVWVYTAEMFPLRERGYCVATTACSNWVGNFVIAQFTPILLGLLGFRTFYVFAVFSVVALYLSWWLPETKGIMLEDMDSLFRRHLGMQSLTSDSVGKTYGALGGLPGDTKGLTRRAGV
mmetsp:Transcript_167851/g.539105  ORF Transcript_167851/g.539105 Transcript_167851/m.539105 type:complete len:494 (+) Transcript_167851:66-1547(+)